MIRTTALTRMMILITAAAMVVASSFGTVCAATGGLDRSVELEARAGIRRGLAYLKEAQKPNGSWQDNAAMTGLIVTAMVQSDLKAYDATSKPVRKALEYIRQFAREDGGIYKDFYQSYSTSICAMALQAADREKDEKRIAAARRFLLGAQADESEDVYEGDKQYGGWGYEKHHRGEGMHRADMSNTHFAVTALHNLEEAWREEQRAREKEPETKLGEIPTGPCRRETQLAYDKAIKYLKKCQNDDGGFIYRPGESKAGKTETGRLRSYGTMTYAGLKSLLYARVKPDDPRVRAAFQWLTNHWTLTENPGMGQQGLYYYYHTMAKCLDVYGEETIVDAGGNDHYWRHELASRLLELQRADGSWVNESGRWMESIPELVTGYSVLALEYIVE